MDVRAFIFSWRGHEARAAALEARLGRLVDVKVINSEEGIAAERPHWVHLDDRAFFSAQWNRAVELFDGDVLFHMQADAHHDDLEGLLVRAATLFGRHALGVYEPNVDYTALRYERTRLRELEPGLARVPMTDCTCWFVRREVIEALPPVDLSVNRYGWGICAAVAAAAGLGGMTSARDYAVTVAHPRGRGYPSADAVAQRIAYLRTLPAAVGHEALRRYEAAASLRPPAASSPE